MRRCPPDQFSHAVGIGRELLVPLGVRPTRTVRSTFRATTRSTPAADTTANYGAGVLIPAAGRSHPMLHFHAPRVHHGIPAISRECRKSGKFWAMEMRMTWRPQRVRQIHQRFQLVEWCRQQGSNPRPPDYKSGALPTELYRRVVPCTTAVPPEQVPGHLGVQRGKCITDGAKALPDGASRSQLGCGPGAIGIAGLTFHDLRGMYYHSFLPGRRQLRGELPKRAATMKSNARPLSQSTTSRQAPRVSSRGWKVHNSLSRPLGKRLGTVRLCGLCIDLPDHHVLGLAPRSNIAKSLPIVALERPC